MQLATLAEIQYRNYASWRTVLKAGRKAGYKYMTILYAGGPFCLLGYEDALLTPGLFANLEFRCVFDRSSFILCVCVGGGEFLMGSERFDMQNLLRMWELACVCNLGMLQVLGRWAPQPFDLVVTVVGWCVQGTRTPSTQLEDFPYHRAVRPDLGSAVRPPQP